MKELQENYVFVDLLKKYKFVLKRKPSTNIANRYKQNAALIALTKKFNEKCNTKLSVSQILKKLNNFKFRLRKKNFESLSRNEQPRFSAVEERFLNLWNDSGIKFSKKTTTKIPELPSEDNKCESISEDLRIQTDTTDATDQPGYMPYPYPDTKLRLGNEYGSVKEEPSRTAIDRSTLQNWDLESDSESESSLNDFDDNDDLYARMTLDELKREVLISKSKMLKAAEASARATEKLKLFELSILQRNNQTGIPSFL